MWTPNLVWDTSVLLWGHFSMAAVGLVYIYTSMSHPGHERDLCDLAGTHSPLQNTHSMLQSYLECELSTHNFLNAQAVNNDVV